MEKWEINFIIRLQEVLRTPFLDYFFYIVSFIGSEYFFMAVVIVIYWCFNKRFAYKFLNVYLAGALLTGVIKTVVARPRPYKRGAGSVISDTDGYSFPSGHSQSTVNMAAQFSLLAYKTNNKKLFIKTTIAGSVISAFVMFSRMYLGQHYLSDVLIGAALGVFSAILFSTLFELLKNREEWLFVVFLPLSFIIMSVLIIINKNPQDLTMLLGVAGAMSLGYFLEKRYIGYDVKSGAVWKQLVKVAAGFLVVLLLKDGLSFFFEKIGVNGRLLIFTDYLRYFLTGIFASFFAPAIFKRIKL